MAKRKPFHKIKIHPNRYLIWAIAASIIVAFGLVSYIQIGNIQFDTDLLSADMEFWHTYKNADLTMRYPAEWLVDPGTGYIGFGSKNDDLFLVYSYSPPNDPAYDSYSKLASTKKIMIGGIEGIRVPTDSKTGQRIAFVKTSKVLFEFRGTTSYFDQILKSVNFIKK